MSTLALFEILARGAASGMVLLLGIALLQHWQATRLARLGTIFALSTSIYVLVSSTQIAAALGPLDPVLSIVAIFNSVFFWWFVTALFCDDWDWEWWRLAPLAGIAGFSLLHFQSPDGSLPSQIGLALWQSLVVILMGHAALFGLNGLRDDLVENRRQFRVVFAVLSAGLGITVSMTEILFRNQTLPDFVFFAHAAAVCVLALLFTGWALRLRDFLVVTTPQAVVEPKEDARIEPVDRHLASQLDQAMAEGIYREANLTIQALSDRVNAPEHRLRKLINQQLGYRNFSSFLNSFRLRDAQEILASPERSRDQVLIIALDLGYGSIAPFNRAFKLETGMTPTEFRRKTLSERTQ